MAEQENCEPASQSRLQLKSHGCFLWTRNTNRNPKNKEYSHNKTTAYFQTCFVSFSERIPAFFWIAGHHSEPPGHRRATTWCPKDLTSTGNHPGKFQETKSRNAHCWGIPFSGPIYGFCLNFWAKFKKPRPNVHPDMSPIWNHKNHIICSILTQMGLCKKTFYRMSYMGPYV